jgi:hypothetical protein
VDSIANRFFVLDDSDVPDEVQAELEAYRPDSAQPSPDTRGVVGDVVVAVLGGLISSGIWDQLPLWASWWSGVGSTFRRANAEEIIDNVASLCVRAGLAARKSDVNVEELVEVPRLGWSGRVSAGARQVSFRTDGRGRIVVFGMLSNGEAAVD